MFPRIDLHFSYWILIWFLLYELKLVSYNPKLFIIMALFANCFLVFLMMYYHHAILEILIFLFIITIQKVIPLYILFYEKTNWKDVHIGIMLFLLYLMYCYVSYGSIEQAKKRGEDCYKNIINGKPFTPITQWLMNDT